jgi:hypothetical protein
MTKHSAPGPYEAEPRAETRAVYDQIRTAPVGGMIKANETRLLAACERAGVQLGAYDRRVLHWLADWEPETVEVIAAIIDRAGVRDA